jgi:SOS response regulatory protein OraA/RecX
VEREETERVVGILREKGLLDDAAVAREFIATRSGRLGHGRLRLLADLVRRGVSPEVAEAAWAEAVRGGDVDPAEAVRRAARRAVSRRGGRLDRRSYPRVYNSLLRQGFDPDAVRAALAEFRTAAGGEAEAPDDVP